MTTAKVMAEVMALSRAKLEAAGIVVTNEAKRRSPVDTGRLRASLTHDAGVDSVRIGTNVEYGPHLELGTSKQAAQPYLVPGLLASKEQLRDIWNA